MQISNVFVFSYSIKAGVCERAYPVSRSVGLGKFAFEEEGAARERFAVADSS